MLHQDYGDPVPKPSRPERLGIIHLIKFEQNACAAKGMVLALSSGVVWAC